MKNSFDDAAAGSELAGAAEEISYGSCPLPDVAATGQPKGDQFRRLADAGYKSVIDLRHPAEPRGFDEAAAVRAAGLRYENIPVTADTLGDGVFDRFREVLGDPANRPALVHCASANRVGALLIPYLMLDQKRSADEALALAQEAGLRGRELADAALAYAKSRLASGQ